MVYGQTSYEQLNSGTRAKGPKGTLQANDGDGCLMSTLANITSRGVLSAPYFVGDGSRIVNLSVPTLQSVINNGNIFTSNTLLASNINVGNLYTHGLFVLDNVMVSNNIQASYFYGDGSQLTNITASTLQNVVDHGNTVTGNTVQFSSLVTPVGSLTGLGTLLPFHTLDVGSNFYVTDTGDARIENLTTNGTYNGISNLIPIHTLDVGSNFYVTDTGAITCVLNTSDDGSYHPVSFLDPLVSEFGHSLNFFNDNISFSPNHGVLRVKGYDSGICLADRSNGSNLWHQYVQSYGTDVNRYIMYYQPSGTSFMSFTSDGRAAFASMKDQLDYIPSTPSTVEFGSNVSMYDVSPSGYVLKVTGNIYSDGGLLTTGTANSGIANVNPVHTLDVGSNLYVSDTGSNVLTVIGGVSANTFFGKFNVVKHSGANDYQPYPVAFFSPLVVQQDAKVSELKFTSNIVINPQGILRIRGPEAGFQVSDRYDNNRNWFHFSQQIYADPSASVYNMYYEPTQDSMMSFSSKGSAAFCTMTGAPFYIPQTPRTIQFGSNVFMYDTSYSYGDVLRVFGNVYSSGRLTTSGLYNGISNTSPTHTLDVGSNLYISDTSVGGNVLSVRGNIFTSGAFQMATLESNGVVFVNSSNILSTNYNSFRYDPDLHILRVDDVGGGDFRLVTGGGIFKQATVKGQAIYTEPNNGGEIHFQLADNGVVANMPCIGLALRDYNNNDTGYIVTHGPIVNLLTTSVMVDTLSPGASGDIGKIVYVSNVAGKLTITRPTSATNLVQNLGIILKVTGNGAGQTFDMQILGTGRYEDAPNLIQAARANVYQYLSVGGALNTSANLYVNGTSSTSNLIVRNTDGAYTIASNTITVNQFGTTYKTFNVSNPPTQIKNIDFTNVIDGAQSILNILGATDIFLNLSNTTGSSTYTKTSLTSNVVLTARQRCIVKCITLDSNTFVDFTKYT